MSHTEVIQITAAKLHDGYRLRLSFGDGSEQVVDFKPFLCGSHHPGFRAYLDPQRFAQFRVEFGELVWGDYDMCFPMMDLYQNTPLHHGAHLAAA